MPYLRTLGELQLDGAPGHLSTPRKQLTLLTYLARHERRGVPRAELADLLWASRDQGRARQSLRQALVELKRTLPHSLTIDQDRVSLVPNGLRIDVAEFEDDLAQGHPEAAVERWRGDFLPGCEDLGSESFRGWLEGERERLRRKLGEGLARLVADARQQGSWERAAEVARCWVQLLPYQEQAHQTLVTSLQAGGQIDAARASHQAFTALLQREFDAQPSAEFQRLSIELQHSKRATASRNPGSAALFTPDLVGRKRAMAELREGWERVGSG